MFAHNFAARMGVVKRRHEGQHRVDQRCKIGARRHAVGSVHRSVMRHGGRGRGKARQMPAGGKTDYADTPAIQTKPPCRRPDHPQCALPVLQRRDRWPMLARQAIHQLKRGHALRLQP
jgi:hypothetical protein